MKKYLVLTVLALVASTAMGSVTPRDLQCEYRSNPVGIDVKTPHFCWKIADNQYTRGQRQTSFHILVASDKAALERGQADVWDSGEVASSQSTLVAFAGKELASGTKYYWKVQVADKDGVASDWSETACFTTGLLNPSDWGHSWWMRHSNVPVNSHILMRKTFSISAPVSDALIHVASLGYHELYINGIRADSATWLSPSLTRYSTRAHVITYDIADLLQTGENVIAIWQAPGWAMNFYTNLTPAVRAVLNGHTTDGKAFKVSSFSDWRCTVGNSKNIGNDNGGELIDARYYIADWNKQGFDDSKWNSVQRVDFQTQMSAQMIDPTRKIDSFGAIKITEKAAGVYMVDMGKNYTGGLKADFHGLASGDTVTLQVADDDSSVQDFGQIFQYVSNGSANETFSNHFNYFGGRYITISGLKSKPQLSDFTGFTLATDLKRTGHFTSSNSLYNAIYETDLWTYRVNTTEGYTSDCPHRERMGYGEVAFATAWGIGFPNYDVAAFYKKVVRDWTDVQEADGWIHHTAPQTNNHYGGPMWSSAGLNISREYYIQYGDRQILELIYPSALRWLEFLNDHTENGLLVVYDEHWGRFLGDWAAPGQRKERGDSPQAQYFNNCVYAMNLETFVWIARLLGHNDTADLYAQRLETLKKNINAKFYDPSKATYSDGNQVQQAFAMLTGLVPEQSLTAVKARLSEEIRTLHPYLDMGSSGLPVLMRYLTTHPEEADAVAKILNMTTEPSYGYFIDRGETTWPEYWNVDVESRIHTCYTGVASWFVKGLCGIRPDETQPGYKHFIIKPMPVSEA
ncbi:MAG: family 78 glycoside hydrolase catalytic domain, partial [Tannerella sp.]|nr:family 78 glycoside hydrolase catalytic domain [Tannerella sp.]